MNILGIDPSLTGTGIAVLSINQESVIECKRAVVVKTFPTEARYLRHRRMSSIIETITEFITENNIKHVAIEGFSLASVGRASSDLPELGGMIRKRLIDMNVDFIEVPPTVLKKRITGKGNCYDKDMIVDAINSILKLNIEKNETNHNAADAIGLGFFLCEKIIEKGDDMESIKKDMASLEIKKKIKKKTKKIKKRPEDKDIIEIPLQAKM